MPLLRLASLIVATLLVAALSALAPPSKGGAQSLSDQLDATSAAAPAMVVAQATDTPWTRVQASAPHRAHGRELVRAPGQSIPEAGQ